jgi:1-acyl-sn-glycerol-3-phosphate acyltransferase
VELFRLNISNNDPTAEETNKALDKLVEKLHLAPVNRKFKWWSKLDTCFRFMGGVLGIVNSALFFSLPMILLQPIDAFLVSKGILSPYYQLSEVMKRQIAHWLNDLAGVHVEVQGYKEEYFKSSCVILTFSHSSNLDGFMVSSTCPVRHYALAKKELFLIPFFSWISLAFGGVPVDRKNRDRAVKALQRSTDAAKNGRICIVVAPEGTRSTTGLLLPFKKGIACKTTTYYLSPHFVCMYKCICVDTCMHLFVIGTFHMWEDIRAPIVPFITFGAFDLYPRSMYSASTLLAVVVVLYAILLLAAVILVISLILMYCYLLLLYRALL